MIKKVIKKQNGFAASDGLTAIIIIALFTGIIATIIYNIYLSNTSIKRMGTATGYIINIIEYTEKAYYDDVSIAELNNYVSSQASFFDIDKNKVIIQSNNLEELEQQIGSENSAYTIQINIEYYNKTEGNTDKKDLVKQIIVTVTYKVGNKLQNISMSKVKFRETLTTPNKPDLTLLEVTPENNIYQVKKIDNQWKVCDERDSGWYNYESGYWATVIISNETLHTGNEVDINTFASNSNMYVWIPKYAYDSINNSLRFLYSNSNKYINSSGDYSILENLENTFQIPQEFTNEITGIWVNNTLTEAYTNLNLIYERQV